MITFDPLWGTLREKNLNKGDLQKMTKLSSTTIAKLAKNEVVKLDVIERICSALDCQIQDVVEIKKS
jgi:DNA-binding Xre family transcriptional regulator